MELSIGSIEKNEVSYNVTLLHKILSLLGFPVTAQEAKARKAGNSTQAQVKTLLAQYNLPQPTNSELLIDKNTIDAVIPIVKQNGLLGSDKTFQVFGSVKQHNGTIAKQQKLLAFDLDLSGAGVYKTVNHLNALDSSGGFEFLGSAETDAMGRYSITFYEWLYRRAERKKADVIVYAIDGDKIIGRSALVRAHDYSEKGLVSDIDITLDQTDTRSEYTRYIDLLRDFLKESNSSLDKLAESAEQLSFTASELDINEAHLKLLADTYVFATVEFEGRYHELLYGLARQEVRITWDALFNMHEDRTRAALKSALEAGIIDLPKPRLVSLFLRAIHEGATNAAIANPNQDGAQDAARSLLSLLEYTSLKKPQKLEFAIALNTFKGNDASEFWTTHLPKQESFKNNPKLVNELLWTQQLAVTTLNYGAMIKELTASRKAITTNGLVNISDKEWMSLIKKAGVPDSFEGENLKERSTNYAKAIKVNLDNAFPNLRVARLINTKALSFASPKVATCIEKFLSSNLQFDLKTSKIHDFDDDLKALAKKDFAPVRSELMTLQRLHAVSVAPEQIDVLKREKLGSSYAIGTIPRKNFVKKYAKELGGEALALRLHNNATFISSNNEMVWMQMHDATSDLMPAAITPHRERPAITEVFTDNGINYSRLFGSPDICECEQCQSIHGPAAYFVDLLRFLWRIPETHGNRTALDILSEERRPDLIHLPLTCENTHTLIPYVDLANEVMEAHVELDGSYSSQYKGFDTGSATAEELRADPQNMSAKAYQILSNSTSTPAIFPFTLPYHQPLDAIRAYVEQLGLSRHELLLAVKNPTENDNATQRAITAESLRLSEAEYQILTGRSFEDESDSVATAAYYGNEPLNDLSQDIPLLLQRLDIPYTDLIELIKTRFLNPHRPLLAFIQRLISNENISADAFYNNLLNIEDSNTTLSSMDYSANDLYADLRKTTTSAVSTIPKLREVIRKHNAKNIENVSPKQLEIWARENLTDFDSIVTLYAPDASCNLENVSLANIASLYRAGSTSVPSLAASHRFWRRLHRFIRLQRKLNLSTQDTDILLSVLGEPDINHKALAKIDSALQLTTLLDLSIAELSTFWGTIPIDGPNSLYENLFLNKAALPIDEDFQKDIWGDYTYTGKTWSDKTPSLIGAFEISEADLTAILDAEEVTLNAEITLQHLSKVFSYVLASRAVDVTIPALITAIRLYGSYPFSKIGDDAGGLRYVDIEPANTLSFFKFIRGVKGNNLSIREVSYIFEGIPSRPAIGASTNYTKPGIGSNQLDKTLRTTAAAIKAISASTLIEAESEATISEIVSQNIANLLGANQKQITLLAGNVDDELEAIRAELIDVVNTAASADDEHSALVLSDDLVSKYRELAVYFERAVLFVTTFSLTEDEIEYFIGHSEDFARLTFENITLAQYQRIENYTNLRRYTANEETDLVPLSLFAGVSAGGITIEDLTLMLAMMADTNLADLAFIVNSHFALDIEAFKSELGILPVVELARKAAELGISARSLVELGKAKASYQDFTKQVPSLKQTVRARYNNEQWLTVAGSLSDKLRQNQQKALVAYLLQQERFKRKGVFDANGLFERLLIDVQMTSCMETSRVVQATAAVQMFVNRVLLNLETALLPESIDMDRWQWMKNYRVWEANRKVFLYPENWLEPEWRNNKSEFFKDLESYLTQNDITDRNTEAALRQYVMSLNKVSNLDICGLYKEDLSPEPGNEQEYRLHVFGRTNSAPYTFYYRTQNEFKKWSAWETVNAGISSVEDGDNSGVHLVPVVWKKRLLIFWPEFIKKQEAQGTTDKKFDDLREEKLAEREAKEYWEIRLAWSENVDGSWTSKQVTKEFIEYNPLERWLLKESEITFTSSKAELAISLRAPVQQKRFSFIFDSLASQPRVVDHSISYLNETYYAQPHDPNRLFSKKILNTKALYFDRRKYLNQVYDNSKTLTESDRFHLQKSENLEERKFFLSSDKETYFVSEVKSRIRIDVQKGRIGLAGGFWPLLEFDVFSHPQTDYYLENLNRGGIVDLLRSDTTLKDDGGTYFDMQYHPEFDSGFVVPHPNKLIRGEQYSNRTFYRDNVCFDSYGANSLYNWELFFHAPLYIATRLSKNGKYEEAMKWFHYIFDPTSSEYVSEEDSPNELGRVWHVLPFRKEAKQRLEEWFKATLSANSDGKYENPTIKEWRDNPFDPHLIAGNRPLAYMKHVVIKYVENLLAWGDAKFKQFTRENVYEALQLYVIASHILGPKPQSIPKRGQIGAESFESLKDKWDDFGNALVELENLFPYSGPISASDTSPGNNILGVGETFYFCIPSNEKLITYWETVEDRLFKIRHCQDIDGIERRLALFAPPIDPALLVQATSQGLNLDDVLSNLNKPAPVYRFSYLLQKANEFCNDVKSLGAAILSAIEKQDAETLGLLRSSQEIILQESITAIREKQLVDAEVAIQSLEKSREATAFRLQTYAKRLGIEGYSIPEIPELDADTVLSALPEDTPFNEIESGAEAQTVITGDSGVKIIYQELRQIELSEKAKKLTEKSQIAELYAGYMGLIPQFDGKAQPLGVGAGTGFGGRQLSWAAGAVAKGFSLESQSKSAAASKASTIASYIRREQEWALQAKSAIKEIIQIDKQITSAKIRYQIADKELENHKKQIENAKEVEQFLREKFSNRELYNWMREQLLFVYKQSYDLCYEMVAKVESAYQYELGDAPGFLQRSGYWDNNKLGLLAGEKLQLTLRQIESRYLEENTRRLELNKSISLLLLSPESLIQLRETGKCKFHLPEEIFDLDYQGHHFRRIKSIAISIPCVAGPYTTVNCTLRLTGNKTRISSIDDTDSSFESYNSPMNAIATSSGLNDTGMFEFNFRDERHLPFEGAGVISSWQLSLTDEKALQQFDYMTISDCIIHCRFTAKEGGSDSDFKTEAIARSSAFLEGDTSIMLDIKRDYGTQWHRYIQSNSEGISQPLTLTVDRSIFPYVARNHSISINSVSIYVKNLGQDDFKLELIKTDNSDNDEPLGEPMLSSPVFDGVTVDSLKLAKIDIDYELGQEMKLRILDSANSPLPNHIYHQIQNIYLVAHYTLDPLA